MEYRPAARRCQSPRYDESATEEGGLVGSRVVVAMLAALLVFATPHVAWAAPEPVLGTARGEMEDPGTLTPIGNGRFAIRDRTYEGKIVAKSVVDEWAACFSGSLKSVEDWSLDSPSLSGTHHSLVTIRTDRAQLTLRLSGKMDFPTASGSWEIARASGSCASMSGEGRYTATFSKTEPDFRLTFEGRVGS